MLWRARDPLPYRSDAPRSKNAGLWRSHRAALEAQLGAPSRTGGSLPTVASHPNRSGRARCCATRARSVQAPSACTLRVTPRATRYIPRTTFGLPSGSHASRVLVHNWWAGWAVGCLHTLTVEGFRRNQHPARRSFGFAHWWVFEGA